VITGAIKAMMVIVLFIAYGMRRNEDEIGMRRK
jgi:hypothetical protein